VKIITGDAVAPCNADNTNYW